MSHGDGVNRPLQNPKINPNVAHIFLHYNPFFGKNAKWNISPKRV